VEPILSLRADGDSLAALHGGMSLASERSGGDVNRGSRRPAPGPRSNAG
jgi:hypothetical protein